MTDTRTALLEGILEGHVVQTELTLDEFLAWNPEEPPYLEYEGKGRVRRKMSPTTDHAQIALWLGHVFLTYGESRQRDLYVYTELRTVVDDEAKVSDVALYVDQRPAENERKQAIVVADLSIEIISPGQSHNELSAKCAWYVEHGGRFAMLIDPRAQSVDLFMTALGSVISTNYGADPNERIERLDDLLPGLGLTPRVIFSVLKH